MKANVSNSKIVPKVLGDWTNVGACVATGGNNCGPGVQTQTRTCTDGTVDPCTTADTTTQTVSCADTDTALPDCLKVLGDWTNVGACVATSGGNCGPGTQSQTRTCEDGTVDKCTAVDTTRSVSCADAGTALSACPGKPQ